MLELAAMTPAYGTTPGLDTWYATFTPYSREDETQPLKAKVQVRLLVGLLAAEPS